MLEHIRVNPIVRVNKTNILPASNLHAAVSSRAKTTVNPMNDLDAAVLRSVFIGNFSATIGRTVINQNYLDILKCLIAKAIDAFWEKSFNVIHWDDYAEPGHLTSHEAISANKSKCAFTISSIVYCADFSLRNRE